MDNSLNNKPVMYERDKKVTLVGETDSNGNMFITGYHKEPSTMSAQTPKVEIGSANTLTPPFPSGVEPVVNAVDSNTEAPIVAEVPVVEELSSEESDATSVPPPPPSPSPDGVPPPKPPKPATMAPVSPLFTEEMQQGGRKSRRNKKTGKKQKGGKLRRKSRKQRK